MPTAVSAPIPAASAYDYRCQPSPCGAHWWMIAPPNGSTSRGVCRYCGKVGHFLNYIETDFKDELEVAFAPNKVGG